MKLSLVFGSVIKLFNVQFRKLHKNEIKTVDKFLAMKHCIFSTYTLLYTCPIYIIDSCFMQEVKNTTPCFKRLCLVHYKVCVYTIIYQAVRSYENVIHFFEILGFVSLVFEDCNI